MRLMDDQRVVLSMADNDAYILLRKTVELSIQPVEKSFETLDNAHYGSPVPVPVDLPASTNFLFTMNPVTKDSPITG